MAFDYTTPTNVFNYLNSAGNGTDPVSEANEMARLVTGMSRAVDQWCNQAFSLATYTNQALRAVVDVEGVLTCYPAVPVMSTPTAASWGSRTFTTIDVTTLDVTNAPSGAVVRAFGSYGAARGQRLILRLSYTGGYANLAAMPEDFTWAVDGLCAWAYQKRSAPIDATAAPAFGQLFIPSNWPGHIKTMLSNYKRWVA
jgi:hypothetical protein